MPRPFRFSAVPVVAAVLSMTGMPLAAADIAPAASRHYEPANAVWSEASQTAHQYRRHGWARGWDRHRHRHRDRGVDAGDVIVGVLILGGIAAIANAVKNDRERDYRDRDVHYPDNRYPEDYRYRDNPRTGWDARSGLDNAAAICASEIEREARVDRVDSVDRTPSGWEVRGALYDGSGFICRIGPDGRIVDVDYSLRRDRPLYRDDADDRWDGYRRD